MLALPIFPCSHPQSIVGEGELNFCVRDGNRWTLTPINTNFVEAFLPHSGCTLKTEHEFLLQSKAAESAFSNCRSSPRLISISQLHALRRFHP